MLPLFSPSRYPFGSSDLTNNWSDNRSIDPLESEGNFEEMNSFGEDFDVSINFGQSRRGIRSFLSVCGRRESGGTSSSHPLVAEVCVGVVS